VELDRTSIATKCASEFDDVKEGKKFYLELDCSHQFYSVFIYTIPNINKYIYKGMSCTLGHRARWDS